MGFGCANHSFVGPYIASIVPQYYALDFYTAIYVAFNSEHLELCSGIRNFSVAVPALVIILAIVSIQHNIGS